MKKIIYTLILIFSLMFTGCDDIKENKAIVIAKQKNILTVHNLQGTRNDNEKWTKIDLYNDISKDTKIDEVIKIEFKTGDLITFKGRAFGGWHDLSDFNIISHDNPLP